MAIDVYRYEFRDILTNEKIDVLNLYGVNMTWNLMSSQNTNFGEFTGTFRSDFRRKPQDLSDMLTATTPGKVCVWVYLNDKVIWGGIVWSRTYSSQGGGTYQLYAQSHDSFLAKVFYNTDRAWTLDARNIIREVWLDTVGNGPAWNLNPIIPSVYTTNLTAITKNVVGGEYAPANEVVEEMVGLGAEYRLVYSVDVNGDPRFGIEMGRWDGANDALPLGTPAETYAPEITYPGVIQNYWLTESASRGAVYVYAIGKGNGVGTPRNFASNPTLVANGYPAIGKKLNFREMESQANLDARIARSLGPLAVPIVSPSFKLRKFAKRRPGVPADIGFGDVYLGDYVYGIVTDPQRFTEPYKGYYRVMNMSLSPEGADNAEEFEFTIAQPSSVIGESGP